VSGARGAHLSEEAAPAPPIGYPHRHELWRAQLSGSSQLGDGVFVRDGRPRQRLEGGWSQASVRRVPVVLRRRWRPAPRRCTTLPVRRAHPRRASGSR
jgi:hypothetical protein